MAKIGVCVVLPDIGSVYTVVCSCKELYERLKLVALKSERAPLLLV